MRHPLRRAACALLAAASAPDARAQLGSPELYPFPSATQVALDFDADRFLDLAFVESGAIRLARNAGDGTYFPPSALALSFDGLLVAVRANGDVERDLLLLGTSAPLAQSFLRTSVPGVLVPGPIFPVPPVLSAGASALFVADLDLDGREDVLQGSTSLLSNGDGTFRARLEAGIAAAGVRALEDLDGDGWLDALSVDPSAGSAPLLAWGSARGFTMGLPLALPSPRSGDPYVCDLDRDGVLDLLCAGAAGAHFAFGLGGRSFAAFTTVPMAAADGPVAAGDFDGDGELDAAFGSRQRLTQIVRNLGGRSFVSSPAAGPSDAQGAVLIAIDLDEDGRDELAGGEGTSLSILWSLGGFAFAPDRRLGWPVEHVRAHDLDRDGDLDVLVGGGSGANAHTFVLRNALDPAFASYGSATIGSGGFAPQLSARGGIARAGNAAFGFRVDLAYGRSVGLVLLGTASAAIALPDAATLYVAPPFELELPIALAGRAGFAGEGAGQIGTPLPLGLALTRTDVYAQAVLLDPGRASALSFTQGLRIRLVP